MSIIIVSRHGGAIDWLRRHYPALADAPVMAAVNADDVRDRIVVGNVPMHLAAQAAVVFALEFEGSPPRGTEYSADDMEAAGARLVPYVVSDATRGSYDLPYIAAESLALLGYDLSIWETISLPAPLGYLRRREEQHAALQA